MADSALRKILMLQKIPSHPRKISAGELRDYLGGEGYSVTIRSLQRDLDELSTHFPIEVDDRSKPYGWYFKKQDVINIPKMDSSTALVFKMVERYLPQLLPPKVVETIAPYFQQAKNTLREGNKSFNTRWANKVSIEQRGIQLQPAAIDSDVLQTVYKAVLEEKSLKICYRDKPDQIIHPHAIVVRGPITYVVCTFWNYGKLRQIALHRIKNAEEAEDKYLPFEGFDLDKYIKSNEFGVLKSDKKLKLKLKFTEGAAAHLWETPFNDSQALKILPDGYCMFTADADDTKELRWWILGFGVGVEVVSPAGLRREIFAEIESAFRLYNKEVGE
jgi:predicted DNA-binding transcriptional regulator YafY